MPDAGIICILVDISLATLFGLFSVNILYCIGFIEICGEICAEDSSEIAKADRSVSSASHQAFLERLQSHNTAEDIRYKALEHSIRLQRELGLRARESFAVKADTLKNAIQTGTLKLSKADMTKSYRPRDISISKQQKEILRETYNFMRENKWHSLIHPDKTLREHSGWAYRQVLNFQKTNEGAGYHFHGNRHFFAQERYSSLWQEETGSQMSAPVKMSGDWQKYAVSETDLTLQEIKEIDTEVRTVVSSDLGHNRLSVTRAYLG